MELVLDYELRRMGMLASLVYPEDGVRLRPVGDHGELVDRAQQQRRRFEVNLVVNDF